MDSRQKFLAVMNGEPGVHTMKWEFGYWVPTLRRWYSEGLQKKTAIPDDVTDGSGVWAEMGDWSPGFFRDRDIHEEFHLDQGLERVPVNTFIHPTFERQVLENHADWEIVRREDGTTARERKDAGTLPKFLQGAVTSWEDWEKLRSERMVPDWKARLLVDSWEDWLQGARKRTYPLSAGTGSFGFYSGLRTLFGDEQILLAFYDNPKLLKEIINYLARFWIELYDPVLSQIHVDCVLFWEDMAYKGGPLISPAMFREFFLEAYQKVTSFCRDHGIGIILVDSDGDVRRLLPLFVEAGVTGMYPFEVTGGQALVEVRQEYPDFQLLGGIDKKAIAGGREEIDLQLRPIPELLRSGRFIPFIDHDVPPDVSWQDFNYYRSSLNRLIDTFTTGSAPGS